MVRETALIGFASVTIARRGAQRRPRVRLGPTRLGYHPSVPRTIQVDELPDIARGCSVLGAGGGGEAYTATLMATQAIADHGPVELVDYDELPQDGMVMSCGFLGAPTVTIEKLSLGRRGAVPARGGRAPLGRAGGRTDVRRDRRLQRHGRR